jgi:hypothetical protein
VSSALRPGGHYFSFEFLHPFEGQDVTLVETTKWHPNELTLGMRPMAKVKALLTDLGFDKVEFRPFELPIDLPFPGYEAHPTRTPARTSTAGAWRSAAFSISLGVIW